jgi:hypothetical protein
MTRFVKELYLAGFAIIFRHARVKETGYKAGSAIGLLTVVEWLILIGASGYVQIFLGSKYLLPKSAVVIAFLVLFFLNGYVLFFRGHGVRFAHGWDSLEKSRRVALVVSCAAVAVAALVFFIFSAIAYRHFLAIRN